MSILIKGMEMPKSCDTCFLSKWDTCNERFYCMFDDCPLVEVPASHGDLIDKSQIKVVELEDSVHLMRWERNSEVDFRIEAPTVIEAEDGDVE